MAKARISENHYRASRVCRVLGNPTAYEILRIMMQGETTPRALAQSLGVSLPTVSQVLRHLRQIDLIRYEVKYNERIYWIKETSIMPILDSLEKLIKKIRINDY